MTNEKLTDYYNNNKEKYQRLLNTCSSVPELLLKIEIYGSLWTQWDWAILFSYLSFNIMQYNVLNKNNFMGNEAFAGIYNNLINLYNDIIDIIDNSNELDKILTNKNVVLNIIHAMSLFDNYGDRTKPIVCRILAHVFKKFPKLWTISWMWTKYRDKNTKKLIKNHRLFKITTSMIEDHNYFISNYMETRNFYDDFQTAFYNL